jgi:cysteinyl-tRNA synthetase
MALQIYSTLSRQKEEFHTLQPGKVTMYVCGPTVYDKAHVGHAMSAIVFDIIRRYLEYRGYQVRHAMNYTDVDDKIINRANQLNIDPIKLAERYIGEFEQHIKDLNILPATFYPRATYEIPYIVKLITQLGENGYAYEIDGDVYFRVSKDEDYGKLSGRVLEEMQAGARVNVDERKENPEDFALWKSSKPGEPAWDSPWGKGRPGWHIECSAMSMHHLGEQIDIHGGGNDLIFPHHENEIAQTESATGKPFASYWVHNGMMQLKVDDRLEKMSKSLGNVVTIEEFLAKHEGDVLRMMVLNSSYRNPLTFGDDIITQAEKALERLRLALRSATEGKLDGGEVVENLRKQLEASRNSFVECMDDDFNTAGALGGMFELVRVINQAKDAGVKPAIVAEGQDLLKEQMTVFGLHTERNVAGGEAAPFIEELITLRSELRQQKLWSLSDKIRTRLAELGVLLEDGKGGTTWRWK